MTDDTRWAPLLALVSDDIDEFMWMYELELEDGASQAAAHLLLDQARGANRRVRRRRRR